MNRQDKLLLYLMFDAYMITNMNARLIIFLLAKLFPATN